MDDLISRAAAKFQACNWSVKPNAVIYDGIKEAIKSQLDMAPAVDAVPVVHGRWIETTIPVNTTGHGGVGQDKKKGWLCSNCKCAFDAKLLWCDSFYPNCGAKMDGERRDSMKRWIVAALVLALGLMLAGCRSMGKVDAQKTAEAEEDNRMFMTVSRE